MLHGWKDNSMLAKRPENSMLTNCLAAYTHLSSTVSQLFELQVQKIAVFTYCSPHFCFPWRRPCDYDEKCCMNGKTIQCLSKPWQHLPIYLKQFSSYWNRKCKKIPVFAYHSLHFCFPCNYHAVCCMDGKRIRTSSDHVYVYT